MKNEKTALLSEAMHFFGKDSPFLDGPHTILEAKDEEHSLMNLRRTEGVLWLLGGFIVSLCWLNKAIKSFALAGAHASNVVLCEDFMEGYSSTIDRLNIKES